MPDPKTSPAVASMLKEQAKQRENAPNGELATGLEDTLPASDPVSATTTSVPVGRSDTDEVLSVAGDQPIAADDHDQYPLVDAALAVTGVSTNAVDDTAPREGLRSLRRDAGRVVSSVSEVADGGAHLPKRRSGGFGATCQAKIRERPLAAVGIVAAITYIWGATR